jgi:hypothetical protein
MASSFGFGADRGWLRGRLNRQRRCPDRRAWHLTTPALCPDEDPMRTLCWSSSARPIGRRPGVGSPPETNDPRCRATAADVIVAEVDMSHSSQSCDRSE